jgi:NADH-ubiquinone oxidoreductase chain 4
LAGILLKLGGYGLYRVLPFLQTTLETYSVWLIVLFSFGGIIASLICIRQTDCKSLVAYSSVAHIALVLVGLVISSTLSVGGAVIIIIAHGLCSSGLFRLVGIIYERTGTRSLVLLRGIIVSTPILTL